MNSYGQPTGPDFAMLDELHRLWTRVFGQGQSQAEAQPRRGKALPVLALIGVAAVVVRIVAF